MLPHMENTSATRGLPKLSTAEEVADVLGVTSRTVYRLRAEGVIPAYRVGGQFRFNIDAVLAALAQPEAAA